MKQKLFRIGAVIASIAPLGIFASHAFADAAPTAPPSLIPIASSSLFAASLSYIPTIFNDLLPYISIVVGVVLAFWLIPKAIALVKRLLGAGGKRAA
jgi:hypothetical protein